MSAPERRWSRYLEAFSSVLQADMELNRLLQEVEGELAEYEARLTRLARERGPHDPLVSDVASRIANLQETIRRERAVKARRQQERQ